MICGDEHSVYFGICRRSTPQRLPFRRGSTENWKRNEVVSIWLTVGYEFTCSNSCTTGINRKFISIVFTLEYHCCRFLGKRAIQIKVLMSLLRAANIKGSEPFPKGKRPRYSPANPDGDLNIKTKPEESDAASTPDDAELPRYWTKEYHKEVMESYNEC